MRGGYLYVFGKSVYSGSLPIFLIRLFVFDVVLCEFFIYFGY